MNVGTRDGRIVSIHPALDAPVSKGHLCVNSIGVLGSARATNEENYLAQKFARVVSAPTTLIAARESVTVPPRRP